MKKTLAILLCLLLALSPLTVLGLSGAKDVSAAYRGIKIKIEGKLQYITDANGVPVEPFIIDGTTYLPIRAIGHALGYDVGWDGPTNTASLRKKSGQLTILEGQPSLPSGTTTKTIQINYRDIKIMVNGLEVIPTDVNGVYVEPFLYNGTTFLPVRAVSQAIGYSIGWDAATSTVSLTEQPQGTLTLEQSSLSVGIGETCSMGASVTPAEIPITYSTGDAAIATVTPAGIITGRSTGYVVITASIPGQSRDCIVNVTATSSAIALNRTDLTLGLNETFTLTAAAPGQTVTWASANPTIATVNTQGLVTAVRVGTTSITATTNTGKTAACTVTVNQTGSTSSIRLSYSYALMEIDDALNLSASGTSGTITWSSSDSSIATVNSSGRVTAKRAGTVRIYARTSASNIDFCEIKVYNSRGVMIMEDNLLLQVDDEYDMDYENSASGNLVWSSSASNIVSVDNYGTVEALRTGTATITMRDSYGNSDSKKVTVVASKGIAVTHSAVTIEEGEYFPLKATTLPAAQSITWSSRRTSSSSSSSANSYATVSANGVVYGQSEGTAYIFAEDANGNYDYCVVTITDGYSTGDGELELSTTSRTINGNSSTTFTLYAEYENGEAVTWSSSDSSIARVSASSGTVSTIDSYTKRSSITVTGVANGTARIRATLRDGTYEECVVTVTNIGTASSLSLSSSSRTLPITQNFTLTASVSPSNSSVSWSNSNSNIITLSATSGTSITVTGKAAGTATITATSNGISRTCTVTVTSFTISEGSKALTVGQPAFTLSSTVAPSGTAVSWSNSASNVVTLSSTSGASVQITAKAAGTATITATAGGITRTCVVTVSAAPPVIPVITLPTGSKTLVEGETFPIGATVTPSGTTLTYTSNTPGVATVSTNGTITAVSEGTAEITVSATGATSQKFNVTVERKVPTGLEIDLTSVFLDVNPAANMLTAKINATITPSTGFTVTFVSDDPAVADVDSTGRILAISAGTATITISIPGFPELDKTCAVKVVDTTLPPAP